MKTTKPIAVFDIDGTIFRSSLLIELNAKLVENGIFPENARDKVHKVRGAWLNRQGSYKEYIDTIVHLYVKDIIGKRVNDIRKASKDLIAEQKYRVYTYTRDLIDDLRRTHTLVLVSFSPTEVVEEFNKYYKFDFVTGIDYAFHKGRYTGVVISGEDLDKKIILQNLIDRYDLELRKSVGVGDTEYDIGFLSIVDRPIAFNPNRELYNVAKRNGWEIVVERKDVVYKIF